MNDSHEPAAHHGPNATAYLVIFGALAVFTAVSFIVNKIYPPPDHTGAAIIMFVAVIKAICVAMIFMHLKWDFSKLYFLVFPVFILATMMMIVLMPDLVFGW
jgi:caa(3)-type oxidase subunit IV